LSSPEDPSFLKTLLDWSWTGVAALVGIVWKANSVEMGYRREGEIKLHERFGAHEAKDEAQFRDVTKQMTDGFAAIREQLYRQHVETLQAIPKRKAD
jgi:hypothetical protein